MKSASKWFRRVEIALWVLGMCLLGAASGATVVRWNYQRQQERALFSRGPAVSFHAAPSHGARTEREIVAPLAPPVTSDESRAPQTRLDDGPAGPLKPARVRVPAVVETRRRQDADPAAVGRLEIPRLGVAAIVSEGTDEGTLDRAVGLLPGSARPGEAGNMVLAGHRDTFFRPLRDIRVNDRIRFIDPDHTYEYRVQSLRVVSPEETSVLASNGVEELTLVTCYPFSYIGSAPERFIVKAARVN